jgi:hypothetical protein
MGRRRGRGGRSLGGWVGATVLIGGGLVGLTASPVGAGTGRSGGSQVVLLTELPRPPIAGGGAEYGIYGENVALSGDTAVVGAAHTDVITGPDSYQEGPGATFLFVRRGARWPTVPTVTLNATGDLAISGSTLVIGEPGADSPTGVPQTGLADVYVRGAHGWPATPTVTVPDPLDSTNDAFGDTVAISGKTMVIGAPGSGPSQYGIAYVYTKGASGWPSTPTLTLPDPYGSATNPSNDAFSGSGVTVSGKTMMIGAVGQAGNTRWVVYQYDQGPTGWSSTPSLVLSASPSQSAFGFPTLSGASALIDREVGNSYVVDVYQKGPAGWSSSPSSTIRNPNPRPNDAWGDALAISGTAALVASGDDGYSNLAGTAYLYRKGTAGYWATVPSATILDPLATKGDQFGYSAAMSGNTVLIGARAADPENADAGQGEAFLYRIG